ncbi:MAG: PQQ-dependent sugar dehydrogenase [Bryobacteraceae bacterium]
MKHLLPCFIATLALAQNAPKLPAPYHTPSAANPPKVVEQGDRQLHLPAGFSAEVYAEGFQKPRYMLQLPGGTVLVTDSVAKGGVFALTGKDKKQLLTGLDRPFGMAVAKGFLYVAEAEGVKRYKLDAKKLELGAGEEVVSLKGYGKGHWTRSLAVDEKAGKLYVSVGSASNIDAGDPKNRAAINAYNLDGSGHQILAGGLRNPVSIHWNPQSHKLWSTVQERDGLGDDLVPDFFTEVKPGAFYGWPFAYLGPNEEPRRKGEAPELVKQTIVPDVILPAHAAVMDFTFYTGKQFPAKYRNGAFLAYRGSSNRAKRVGYSVTFVPFQGGRPAGAPEEFLTGWMIGEDSRDVWGRPVGLLQLADGSLLVSEDGNNRIWRIRFKS